jgi:rod shape-determining protein MreB
LVFLPALRIGESTSEQLKLSVGAVLDDSTPREATVRGRHLVTGLPKEVVITDEDVREAIRQSVESIVEGVREVLEESPPTAIADIMETGINITGGGALLRGVPQLLTNTLGVPVNIANDPLTSVVRGTGTIVEHLSEYADVLLDEEARNNPFVKEFL